MDTNWQEVTALIAGFAMMGAVFMFATEAIVSRAIAKLNGTYVRSDEFEQYAKRVEEHFDFIASQVAPVLKDCPLLHYNARDVPKARVERE